MKFQLYLQFFFFFFFLILTQGHFSIAFRERVKERDKHQHETEASISCLMSTAGPGAHNPDRCPDKESNPQPFHSRWTLQPTEPHQPGLLLQFWTGLTAPFFYPFGFRLMGRQRWKPPCFTHSRYEVNSMPRLRVGERRDKYS